MRARSVLFLGALLLALSATVSAQMPVPIVFPPTASGGGGSLALDGSASLQGSSGASGTVTLTTTAAGEIIVPVLSNNSDISSVTASGLTFSKRAGGDVGGGAFFSTWAAPSSGAQTALVITVNCTGTSSFLTIHAFGVSGGNLSTPFDPNVALPDFGTGDPRSVTTTHPVDMLIYSGRSADTAAPSAAAGWTTIVSGGFALSQYKLVSMTQPGTSVSSGSGTSNGAIADAIQGN